MPEETPNQTIVSAEALSKHLLTLTTEAEINTFLTSAAHSFEWRICLATAELLKEVAIKARRRDAGEALRIASLVVQLSDVHNCDKVQAIGLRIQAFVHLIDLKNYQLALNLYADSAELYRRANDPLGIALVNVTRVWAFASLGRYDEAFAAGETARQTLISHQRWRPLATLSNNLAAIHGRRSQFEQALKMFDSARAAYKRLGTSGRQGVLATQFNQAIVLRNLGRFEESIRINQAAIQSAQKDTLTASAARGQHTLGITWFIIGRPNRAILLLDQARDTYLADGRKHDAILVDLGLCDGLLSLGRHQDVLDRAQSVQALCHQLAIRQEEAQIIFKQAMAHAGLADIPSALAKLDEARALYQQDDDSAGLLDCDIERASLLYELGREPESLQLADYCIAEYSKQHLPVQLVKARLVAARAALALHKTARATSLTQTALAEAQQQDILTYVFQAHFLAGQLAAHANRPTKALNAYSQAITTLEKLQGSMISEFRSDFLLGKQAVYDNAVALCLEMNEAAQALSFAERAKSRALLDIISHKLQRRIEARDPADQTLVDELTRLKKQRDALYRRWEAGEFEEADLPAARNQIHSAENQITHLWHTLLIRNERYADEAGLWQVQVTPAGAHLDADSVLVEYVAVHGKLYAFIVSQSQTQAILLPFTLAQTEQQQQRLKLNFSAVQRTGMADAMLPNALAILQTLHTSLIQPLLPHIAAYKKLIIVPHGSLHYLPFHALHNGDHYLLSQFDISYLPASSFLPLYEQTHTTSGDALVMGHSYNGLLENVSAETQQIATFLDTKPLLESQATRQAFFDKAPHCRIIHLATHGDFHADNPLFSGLALHDGWLTTLDIFNLHLNASLITLSACQTGRTLIGGGDELLGLMRALLTAGVKSVVLSHWSVEDTATRRLMAAFYHNLATGLTKSNALRQAQRHLLSNGEKAQSHPFYWAAFFLVGNGGDL